MPGFPRSVVNARTTALATTEHRTAWSSAPQDLSGMLTPSVAPYHETDGLSAITGWDSELIICGEDGQIHALSKTSMRVRRLDREPNWQQGTPWSVELTSKSAQSLDVDSRNTWFRASARETWTYSDPGTAQTITTGYALLVGSGDRYSVGDPIGFRTPSLYFVREGATAAQSLTAMLAAQGFMPDNTKPRNLHSIKRTSADEFYVSGAGFNGSTSGVACLPTFGRITLTLDSSKTQTGAQAVTALTWTDYTASIQALMPGGETVINIPAIGGINGNALQVLVITKDGSAAYRYRLVQWDRSAGTGSIPTANNAAGGAAIFPITVSGLSDDAHIATITRGAAGTLMTLVKDSTSAGSACYFRNDADTSTNWRNVTNQVGRALGRSEASVFAAAYDATESRWVVTGNLATDQHYVGVLDVNCKYGKPLSGFFPVRRQRAADNVRKTFGVYADDAGTWVCGSRQMLVYVPRFAVEQAPVRVLWGLRIKPTANNGEITITEGEALLYRAGATGRVRPVQIYYAGGGTIASLTFQSPAAYTVVLKNDGTVAVVGSLTSGADYPQPALADTVVLGTVSRNTATAQPITTAEIDMVTFRDR